jgi:hypothetical protein
MGPTESGKTTLARHWDQSFDPICPSVLCETRSLRLENSRRRPTMHVVPGLDQYQVRASRLKITNDDRIVIVVRYNPEWSSDRHVNVILRWYQKAVSFYLRGRDALDVSVIINYDDLNDRYDDELEYIAYETNLPIHGTRVTSDSCAYLLAFK